MSTIDQHSEALAYGVLARDFAVLSRTLSLAESSEPSHREQARDILQHLQKRTGKAIRVVVSNSSVECEKPFVGALGQRLVEQGHRVAVLATPCESVAGDGGDSQARTRMAELAMHDAAFVHPRSAGKHPDETARMVRESLLLCEAAGFDVVLIECTGTMQSLAAITDVVDCHLALMPSSLDDASTASGEAILETADIVVVNSLDETRDSRLMQDTETYQRILSMRQSDTSWSPPVLACNTLSEGGLDELWQQVRLHRRQMIDTGEFIERRERQNAQWC